MGGPERYRCARARDSAGDVDHEQEASHAFRDFRNLGTDRSNQSDAADHLAASALQDGDSGTLMLFHDVVLMAVEGAGAKLVPVGLPNRYEEVAAHPRATLWACRPCVDARGLAPSSLDHRIKLGGMNEYHAIAKQLDVKLISF